MTDPYELHLKKRIEDIDGFKYDNIKFLDRYPIATAELVLKELLENSCLGQNCVPIQLGRSKLKEVNRVWLQTHLMEVAFSCIDFSDEWEYRRLVELVIEVIPELKDEILHIGENSENQDIREVVDDFKT